MGSAAGEGEAPSYDIAVLKGDGVGPDMVDEAVRVLEAAVDTGGTHLKFSEYPCGTDCYLEQDNAASRRHPGGLPTGGRLTARRHGGSRGALAGWHGDAPPGGPALQAGPVRRAASDPLYIVRFAPHSAAGPGTRRHRPGDSAGKRRGSVRLHGRRHRVVGRIGDRHHGDHQERYPAAGGLRLSFGPRAARSAAVVFRPSGEWRAGGSAQAVAAGE